MSTPAIELLKRFAQDSEENSKIQRHEGFNEESVNSAKNAESYRDAVIVLELEYAQQRYHNRYSHSLALKS